MEREILLSSLRPIINGTIPTLKNNTDKSHLKGLINGLEDLLGEIEGNFDFRMQYNGDTTLIHNSYIICTPESLLVSPESWSTWSISDKDGKTLAVYDRNKHGYKNYGLRFLEAQRIINGLLPYWRRVINSEELTPYFERIRYEAIWLLGALLYK